MLEHAHLYAITPDAEPARIESLVEALVAGGVDVIQLRHKSLSRGELFRLASRIAATTRAAGIPLIVNDHLDIALLAGAAGVHLGEDDLPVEVARRLSPAGFLVGASANRPEAAREAAAAGADYIGCGPSFATTVKPDKAVVGPDRAALVQAAVEVPVFAIGGVDAGNVGALVAAGIRRACVISALADAADPAEQARRMRATLCG